MPHTLRLRIVLLLFALDVAFSIALRYLDPALVTQLREIVAQYGPELLALALGGTALDALHVELRRRQPGVSALPDDVIGEPGPRVRRPPPLPILLALPLVLLMFAPGCSAATMASAGPAIIKARDLSCGGARILARVTDRACRISGGPWVVPQTEAEREQWDAMGGGGDEPDGPTSGDDDELDEAGGESSVGGDTDDGDVDAPAPRPLLEIVDGRFLASGVGITPDGNPRVLGRPGDTSDAEERRVIEEWRRLWRERRAR